MQVYVRSGPNLLRHRKIKRRHQGITYQGSGGRIHPCSAASVHNAASLALAASLAAFARFVKLRKQVLHSEPKPLAASGGRTVYPAYQACAGSVL